MASGPDIFMSIREILKMGDPRLLRQALPVTQFDTDELYSLIADLLDTLRATDGIGLAAPQIGVHLQVVIVGADHLSPRYPTAPLIPVTVLINPTITPLAMPGQAPRPALSALPASSAVLARSDLPQNSDWEGCLSLPGLRGLVPRFTLIRTTGFDPCGDPIDRLDEGFVARVVQHECDHLAGVLYPMRITDFRQFGFSDVLPAARPAPTEPGAATFNAEV